MIDHTDGNDTSASLAFAIIRLKGMNPTLIRSQKRR